MRYRTMTDAELVRRAAEEDCEAFGELVIRWHRVTLAAAYRAVSSDDAEDAVQEAFIAAWLKIGSLREPAKFGAWVCRIAVNRAKNARFMHLTSFPSRKSAKSSARTGFPHRRTIPSA